MLCKRCPIIVKISKQIVKIDRHRLSSFRAASSIHSHSIIHIQIQWMLSSVDASARTASFSEFWTVLGAEGDRCLYGCIIRRVSIELLSLPRIFLFDIESFRVCEYLCVCVLELIVCVPIIIGASEQHQCQPEGTHKLSDLIKLASLENCLNSLFVRGLTLSGCCCCWWWCSRVLV